jgi:hypothetical protein
MIKFSAQQEHLMQYNIDGIRRILSKHGSAHGLWDTLAEYEEAIQGRKTLYELGDANEWIDAAVETLKKLRVNDAIYAK